MWEVECWGLRDLVVGSGCSCGVPGSETQMKET